MPIPARRNRHSFRFVLLSVAATLVGTSCLSAEDLTSEQLEFFEQQVRPLLVKRCYECHSTDASEPEGGLRLDSRNGWETGGDSGAAIEAGNVEGSLLITAVRYDGLEMPPEGKLPPEEIDVLVRWVEMGAPDPRTDPAGASNADAKAIDFAEARRFWAFQQPRKHEPPEVRRTTWPHDDLDRFILAGIESAGTSPTRDADRRTWLRRVTFDLTGLPPTIDEIESFLSDGSLMTAKARVVDRLLASSAFGEHWGRYWLDVARYADTNGGDFNATFKSAWRYRDYVINSFNNDKPFDQFVREQLAGDLMTHANRVERAERLIATGFLMIGCKMLSERDKAKFRMDVVDEQIDTVGRAFLGLTLGCARCHDHKFDPVPSEDYYALAGIFQSTESYRGESQKYVSTWKEVDLPVPPDTAAALKEHTQRTEQLQAAIRALEEQEESVAARLGRLDRNFAAKRHEAKTQKLKNANIILVASIEGIVVDDAQAVQQGEWKKSTFTPRYVDSGYIHNNKEGLGEKAVTYTPNLPAAGRYEVRMSYAGSGGRATNVPVVVTHADGKERLTVDQAKPAPIDDLWLSLGTFPFAAGTEGSVTISTTDTDGYVLADAVQFLPVDPKSAIERSSRRIDSGIRSEALVLANRTPEAAELHRQYQEVSQRLKTAQERLKHHEADGPPSAPTCMAVREHAQIGDAAMRIRGDVHREGEIIPRGFLTILSEAERLQLSDTSQSGRRELADWIASPTNPLTARVIVNRVWHHLFGRGIVASVDNFGQLGQRPTHPELLDTLAVEFMEDGWSVKRLVRRIVLSRTYGLSSLSSASTGEDPENRLLSHARRRRLAAESLRDAMLAASGLLDSQTGGSSVEPLAYLAIATTGKRSADLNVDENVRRSVYLPMVRNDLPEFLRLFDAADPELVTGRRPVTNVPAQALYLMNSPFVTRAAERTADRIRALEGSDEARLVHAYELLYARRPTNAERVRGLRYLEGGDRLSVAWQQLIHVLFASTEFRMLD